jgi:hypothetical protein
MHLANPVRRADDFHQNSALPCFLRAMMILEDVNDLRGKIPTEANTFPGQTVVNSKLLLLEFH